MQFYLLARPCCGPQIFSFPLGIVGDHGVGRVQDILGGAVVLFQPDDRAAPEILFKVHDVLNGGAPEFIDALVVVAHHAEIIALPRQKVDKFILGMVGILVLVHHDVPEPVLVIFQHLWAFLKQSHRIDDEIIEVHGVGILQPAHCTGAGVRRPGDSGNPLPLSGAAGT